MSKEKTMSLCRINKLAAVVAMSFVLSSAAFAGSPVTTPNTPNKGNAGKFSTTDGQSTGQSQSQTQSVKVDTQLGGNSKGSGIGVKDSDGQSQGSQSQSQTQIVDKGSIPSKLPSKLPTIKGDKGNKGDVIDKGANKGSKLGKNKKRGDNN
jgi:hypothetical protein